jgi:hypothetical protein
VVGVHDDVLAHRRGRLQLLAEPLELCVVH